MVGYDKSTTGKHDKSHRKSIAPSTLNAVWMFGTSPQEMRIVTIDPELVWQRTTMIAVWSRRSFANIALLQKNLLVTVV